MKKRGLGIHIHLTNRWLYTFIVLGILAIIGVGVYAYGTSTPSTFGHSSGEIVEADPQVGILTNGKWCTSDGSAVNCNSNAPTTLAGVRIYKVTNSYCTTSGLTDSATCWTRWSGNKAYDCSGNLNQASQIQCPNQPIGYLLA